VLANTFYSHFVYRALATAGRFDLVLTLIRERYGPMLARGATTLWESFDPTASLCHGFSTTPLYQLSAEMLGVQPTSPGFATFDLAPQLGDCAYARGVFPTGRGDISVAWERTDNDLRIEVEVPKTCVGTFVVPDGYRITDGGSELGAGRQRLHCTIAG
jgi:hypothetical protein